MTAAGEVPLIAPRFARLGFWPQLLAVAVFSGSMASLTDRLGYRTGWNVFWMAGLPIALALYANRDAGSRALMAMILVVGSFLAMGAAAAIFGLGP